MNVSTKVSRHQIFIDRRETYYEVVAKGYGKWAVQEGSFNLSSIGGLTPLTPEECVRFCVKPGQKYLFELEPQPSSREDDFLARARFDSVEAAVHAFEQWLEFADPRVIRYAYVRKETK